MSPEQIAGKKVDGRADLFSLGVTLYELLTGEKPFQGDSIGQLLFQITSQQHPSPQQYNPKIPDCLVKVIDKTLAKEAEQRYQRGSEIVNDLKECLKQMNQADADKTMPFIPPAGESPK
jgi:serine/threonine-protein kinase